MAPIAEVHITLVSHVAPDIIPVGSTSVTVTNAATVHLDGESHNTQARGEITGVAELVASKTASPNPVLAGSELTFTLGVTNHGPSNANQAFIEDTLPPGVTFLPARSDPRCDLVSKSVSKSAESPVPPGTVVCGIATLAPGHAATFTVVGFVGPHIYSGDLGNVSAVGSNRTIPTTRPNLRQYS